ncbi:MAG: redoxin domain-containing protein [Bacteroidales bacterium]|nr:redoxin domain-containing protein [Bacteroidales bacterium]
MYLIRSNDRSSPFEVGDYDIPAFWPRHDIKDLVTGKTISYKEIVSKNKATVLLNWATWCPFSKELMPVLKKMYDKYHGDGLEIIASFNADTRTEDSGKSLKEVILERNYDKWYNFNIWDLNATEWSIWCSETPSANVVDNKGNIMTSSRKNVTDHAKNRYGYLASTKLIPILESIFGPLEDGEDYSSTDYSRDGEVITLQKASVGKGKNIVFMGGDAYVDKDMGKGGSYEYLMRQSMEQFFAIEPYKTFRNRFNVYAVKVVSKNDKTGDGYSTALGSVATYGSISHGNIEKCFTYALKVPGIKDRKNLLIGVLVNSLSARGITHMSESNQSGVAFYASTNNDPEAFGIALRHEAGGHGFAFLDDEYGYYKEKIPQEHIDNRNSMYNKYGWYSNVDFTDDPAKVHWSDFLSDDRYKDEVGIFKGGSLYEKGAYRPSQNSMMRDNYDYYNAPSRWAIYKRIMELSGETASFKKFLEYDAVNRGKN